MKITQQHRNVGTRVKLPLFHKNNVALEKKNWGDLTRTRNVKRSDNFNIGYNYLIPFILKLP